MTTSLTVPADIKQAFRENEETKVAYEQAIASMGPHVKATNRVLKLVAKNGVDVQVDSKVFDNLEKSLALSNTLIDAGQLGAHDVLLQESTLSVSGDKVTAAGICAGRNGTDTHWWGITLYADECRTQHVINLIGSGAGTAVIAAVLGVSTGGTLGTILGFIIKAGVALLKYIDRLGGHKGLYFSVAWVGIPWLWHQ